MKKLLIAVLVLSLNKSAFAQEKHVLTVLDSVTNEPIRRATITGKDGYVGLTGQDGNLTLTLKDKQTLTLTISAIGYKTINIDVSPEKSYVFKMTRNIKFMDPIEIKTVRSADNYPFTKSLLTKKDIDLKNTGQDLPFILNQVPGSVVNSDAGNGIGYTGIRIRGTDPSRINITLNGIPYNDAESQGVFFVNIPDIISSTNNIQVQRGVGTSSNGPGAFGATINLMTNEAITTAYGMMSNSIGSFQTIKNTVKAGTGLINNQYTVDMRLSSIQSRGYVDRASSNLKSFYFSAASLRENSSLRLNIFSGQEKTYQAWYGISEEQLASNRRFNVAGTEKDGTPYDNETDNYKQTHYQLFYNKKINSQWSINNSTYLTDGSGYYEQYKKEQEYKKYGLADVIINNSSIQHTDLVRQLWLKNRLIGDNISLQYKTNRREILLGMGANIYTGDHFGKVIWANISIPKDHKWYDLNARKTEQFVFGKILQKINNKTTFFGDLQLRNLNYNIDGFRNNPALKINSHWTFLNPKFGVRKNWGKYNAYVSYAMANKEPNRDDFEAGLNEKPKHETLHDFELGIEKKKDNKSISITTYYMLYKNQLVLTGKINDVGAYTRTNIPFSYRLGVELEGSFLLMKWLGISGNIALSENKLLDYVDYYDDYDEGVQKSEFYAKSNISFSPSLVGSTSITANIRKGLQATLLSKYVSKQNLDNTSRPDRQLNAFFTQDIQVNYQIKSKHLKTLELILQLNNIWSKLYEPNGYTYTYKYEGVIYKNNYFYPMAQFNFMTSLNIGF